MPTVTDLVAGGEEWRTGGSVLWPQVCGSGGLSHTHAPVLLEAGENVKVVKERLGHTTMDVYSYVTLTMQRSAVDRFTAAISGPE